MKVVRNFLCMTVMAVLLAVAVPTTSLGQDRQGRWRGRGNGDHSDWSRRNRKCRKFRNCHDARDGRWDGRGPSGDRVSSIFRRNRRNRDRNRSITTRRWRDRNYDSLRVRRLRDR